MNIIMKKNLLISIFLMLTVFSVFANNNFLIGSVTKKAPKATPVITWSNPTDIVYGTPLSSTQLNATADVPGTFVYTPALGTILNADASHDLVVDFTPDDLINYTATSMTVQITVTQALLTVTAENKSKTYGAANPALTFTYSGFVNSEDSTVLTTLPIASTSVNETTVTGNYAGVITISGGVDENYSFIYIAGDFDVTKASLTVTATDTSRLCSEANPVYVFTYAGFVNGDDSNDLSTLPTITCDALPTSPAGNYTITVSGGIDENYDFFYINGTLTILDTVNPVAVCTDINVYLDSTGNVSILATDINNGSSDNCNIASMTVTPNSFDCADVGANTVTLTVTDDANNTNTCTAVVTVIDTLIPVASFTYAIDSMTVTFTNTSVNGYTYKWLFGDEFFHNWILATNGQDQVHTYSEEGIYTVEMVVTSPCGTTDTIAIDVSLTCPVPASVASFTYTIDSMTVTFSNTSTNGDSYQWLFGDEIIHNWLLAATDINPAHTYGEVGNFTAEMVATNICGITDTFSVVIALTCPVPDPIATFTYTIDSMTVSFTNASSNGASYQWLFGDEITHSWFLASNDTNPIHTYTEYGTFTVEMVATNICGITDTFNVVITLDCPVPAPDASFTFSIDSTTVSFTNTSTNGASFQWLFGDEITHNWLLAATDTNPAHTYQNYGTFNVEMVVTNICGVTDTFVNIVTLTCPYPAPVASFTYAIDSTTVNFTNTSVNSNTYQWLFGDEIIHNWLLAATDTNPSHIYANYDTFTVEIVATNLCGITDTVAVDITLTCPYPAPVASFTYAIDSTTVNFTNTSVNSNTYQWLFGDEIIHNWLLAATDTNPSHIYANYGTFTVEMVATNLCGITDTVAVDITLTCPYPAPVASFTYAIDSTTVNFTNTSVNSNTYQWLFGDEIVHNWFLAVPDTNPTHTYSGYETFTVEMVATNLCGITDTVTVDITLVCPYTNLPVASFLYMQDSLTVSFMNTSTDADNYIWYFGDEAIILPPPLGGNTEENPSHTYASDTIYTVTLIASNSCGYTDTLYYIIDLNCNANAPVALFNYTNNNFTVSFANNSSDAVAYKWFFGDEILPADGDTSSNPVHAYQSAGTYNAVLIAYNQCGVTDTLTTSVCVALNPVAEFTNETDNLSIGLRNESTNAVSYTWYFGDGETSTIFEPIHTYAFYGTYAISLVAANTCGITDSVSTTVTIVCPGTMPVSSFNYSRTGMTLTFNNTSTNAASYKWLFGDESSATWDNATSGQHQTHTYTQFGTYFVLMTALNECGGDTTGAHIMITSVESSENVIMMICYPNPAQEMVTIAIENVTFNKANIVVNDMLGRTIHFEEIPDTSGTFKKSLDVSNWAKGIYYLKINNNETTFVSRIIVQ